MKHKSDIKWFFYLRWQSCKSKITGDCYCEATSQGTHTWIGVTAAKGDVSQNDREGAFYTFRIQSNLLAFVVCGSAEIGLTERR